MLRKATVELLDIAEVAAASGLRPSALRYYEEAGLIRATGRARGRRQYDPTVLRRLEVIALCREVGFTLPQIARLLNATRDCRQQWNVLAEKKLAEIGAHIQRAQAARALLEQALSCGCADPVGCGLVHEVAADLRRQKNVLRRAT